MSNTPQTIYEFNDKSKGFVDVRAIQSFLIESNNSRTSFFPVVSYIGFRGGNISVGYNSIAEAVAEKEAILRMIRGESVESSFNERLEKISKELFNDIDTFKDELRSLIKDTVGMTSIAALAEINRTQLSKTLGKEGNPNLTLLMRILKAVKHAIEESNERIEG